MTKNEVKNALIKEISKLAESKLVNVNPKRITVRPKLIWEDFKNQLVRKVTPTTKIKVFSLVSQLLMMVVLKGNYFQVNFKITVNKGCQKLIWSQLSYKASLFNK